MQQVIILNNWPALKLIVKTVQILLGVIFLFKSCKFVYVVTMSGDMFVSHWLGIPLGNI